MTIKQGFLVLLFVAASIAGVAGFGGAPVSPDSELKSPMSSASSGYLDFMQYDAESITDLDIEGERAYVAATNDGIWEIDISDPNSISRTNTLAGGYDIFSVEAVGRCVFGAASSGHLLVYRYETSSFSMPDSLYLGEAIVDFKIRGAMGYAVTANYNLFVINCTDIDNLVVENVYGLSDYPISI